MILRVDDLADDCLSAATMGAEAYLNWGIVKDYVCGVCKWADNRKNNGD
jgi:hypothetical protein